MDDNRDAVLFISDCKGNEWLDVAVMPDFILEIHKLNDEKFLISEDHKKIHFRNYAGYFNADGKKYLVLPNKICSYLGIQSSDRSILRDDSPEIKAFEALYLKMFNQILETLPEHLLFNFSPAEIKVDESLAPASDFYRLFLLLNRREEIETSIHFILSNPHRKLVEYEDYLPLNEVSEVNGDVLLDIIHSPDRWIEHKDGFIPYNNVWYYPEKVLQYRTEESFDTPENRFVLFFLKELAELLEKLISKYGSDFNYVREKLEELLTETDFAQNSPVFEEVEDLRFFPSNSQVLMKKAGYRELFGLYRLLHTGMAPSFFKTLDLSLPLKDMATLWEYYVLAEMVKELEGEFGKAEFKIVYEGKQYETAVVFFENNIKIDFQKSKKAYSGIELRPDFYLEYHDRKIVFDAKFRLFENNNKDILKNMHYYKDALNLSSSVAVCFPENIEQINGCFFSEENDQPLVLNGFRASLYLEDNGVGYFDLNIE